MHLQTGTDVTPQEMHVLVQVPAVQILGILGFAEPSSSRPRLVHFLQLHLSTSPLSPDAFPAGVDFFYCMKETFNIQLINWMFSHKAITGCFHTKRLDLNTQSRISKPKSEKKKRQPVNAQNIQICFICFVKETGDWMKLNLCFCH